MPYVDLDTVFNPAVGQVVPVEWLEQIRENFQYVLDPPRCGLYGDATTCANNTWTDLDAKNESFDTDGMHSGTNDYLTIQTAGTYDVGLRVQWDATDVGGSRGIGVVVNPAGANTRYVLSEAPATPTSQPALVHAGAEPLSLAAGDILQPQGRPSGEVADGRVVKFWVRWIGL